MDDPRPDIIAADWLAATDRPGRLIRRGGVRVGPGERVAAVGPVDDIRRPGDNVAFFADCVLTAGLVNAHAHLDLAAIADAAGPLHEWVGRVLAQRRSLSADETAAVAVAGARQSLAAGVTTVIDVTPAGRAWSAVRQALAAGPPRRVALMEVLGFGDRGRQLWAEAEALFACPSALHGPDQARPEAMVGISPHAPYSTAHGIYRRSLALARGRGWPIMTHLSETRQEIEFCRAGAGPWRQLLESRYGPLTIAPLPGWPPDGGALETDDFAPAYPGCSPVAYAARLGLLDYRRTLLAHVNYLEPGDLELLVGGRATVVYCPRSADYFGHRDHPWRKLLAAGVNVAVGADSLASSPDLSVINELRFLHERCPEAPAGELFALATANAPRLPAEPLGVLAPGALADLAAWPVAASGRDADSILAGVLESCEPPRAVFLGGRMAYGSR